MGSTGRHHPEFELEEGEGGFELGDGPEVSDLE